MSDNKLHDLTGQDRTLADYQNALDQNLKSGGGGGTFDGMEPRIARLEAHMEHVQADLVVLKTDMGAVKDRLARLEVKVDHLPSKGFIVTALIAMLAVIGALVTYQEQIKAVLP